ncbi:MAG TPA: I78 family peptidase inhibitor [Methylomirabilota bacterium]|nr:I78 family peptidase inhibitor [Methylomirabilota bacterium]
MVAACVETTRPGDDRAFRPEPLPPGGGVTNELPRSGPPTGAPRRNDPITRPPDGRNDPPRRPGPAACDASAARFAIGREPSRDVVEEAIRSAGATEARVIPFGAPATMDFMATRLTIELDRRGRIDRIMCG